MSRQRLLILGFATIMIALPLLIETKTEGLANTIISHNENQSIEKSLISSRMNFFVNTKIMDENHRNKIHQEIAALITREKMNIVTEQDFKIFVNALIKNLPQQSEMSYLKSYLVFQVKKVEDQHPHWSEHLSLALYSELNEKQRSIVSTLESAQF